MRATAKTVAFAALLVAASTAAAAPVTVTYTAPGTYVFTVPAGVTSIAVEAEGGGGGGGSGGSATSSQFTFLGNTTQTTATGAAGGDGAHGELVTQAIAVTPGEVITVVVGAGGAGGEASNSWFPVEIAEGGAGGAGHTPGGAGSSATGGYNNNGWLSGAGGGAGGSTAVIHGGGTLAAQGGGGGGGGGAAFALDTTAPVLALAGVPGFSASAGGTGGECRGWVNSLSVSVVNNPSTLNQACQPRAGSLYNATVNEVGGSGASGYIARGDVPNTGGAGGPTVVGGTANTVNGTTFFYHTSDGAAGSNGASGRVQLTYAAPPTPVPAVGLPALLLGMLAVGWFGARRFR